MWSSRQQASGYCNTMPDCLCDGRRLRQCIQDKRQLRFGLGGSGRGALHFLLGARVGRVTAVHSSSLPIPENASTTVAPCKHDGETKARDGVEKEGEGEGGQEPCTVTYVASAHGMLANSSTTPHTARAPV
jgi:hypothetical protein